MRPEHEEQEDVRHLLVVANHDGVFVIGELVPLDFKFVVANMLCNPDRRLPPAAGAKSIVRAECFSGKGEEQRAEELKSVGQ
ncbi:MAG: hypothetical protein A2070_12465 [Bdellovibrionales bacterium GWC1_52_8]|nr:MAG: hypothetical protein A2Z97_06975 [Bdellovibrionales bacterium GWB1_52_6]OFZ36284.1 MAG: hypothetical protein A2070_12465 [Bdellovibrionales bacterium GWC1_52_8]